MDLEIRRFEEELYALVNSHSGLNWETKLICLELVTEKTKKLADEAIMEQLNQEAESNAEGLQQDKL